jgi:serine/threonine-protein kinase PknK
LLSASDSADDREQACRRAVDLLAGIDSERRPLAALTARLLLAETLQATGRAGDADVVLPDVLARCEQLGLPRLIVDAGLG